MKILCTALAMLTLYSCCYVTTINSDYLSTSTICESLDRITPPIARDTVSIRCDTIFCSVRTSRWSHYYRGRDSVDLSFYSYKPRGRKATRDLDKKYRIRTIGTSIGCGTKIIDSIGLKDTNIVCIQNSFTSSKTPSDYYLVLNRKDTGQVPIDFFYGEDTISCVFNIGVKTFSSKDGERNRGVFRHKQLTSLADNRTVLISSASFLGLIGVGFIANLIGQHLK